MLKWIKNLFKRECKIVYVDKIVTKEVIREVEVPLKNSTVNSKSGYKGIHYNPKNKNPYRSYVSYQPKKNESVNTHIGHFHTLEEAIEARIDYIKKLL